MRKKRDNWRLDKPQPGFIKAEDEHLWPGAGSDSMSAFLPDPEYQAKKEAYEKWAASQPPAPGAARE